MTLARSKTGLYEDGSFVAPATTAAAKKVPLTSQAAA
jgi:hypothetical protein